MNQQTFQICKADLGYHTSRPYRRALPYCYSRAEDDIATEPAILFNMNFFTEFRSSRAVP